MPGETDRGIIYIMSTALEGLIKIGCTNDFENRMHFLESNGYRNINGLKREFAIEVDDYKKKEALLHKVFGDYRLWHKPDQAASSKAPELFAIDLNLAIQLLSSFDGTEIYPAGLTRKEVFDSAVVNSLRARIPEGTYHMEVNMNEWGLVKGIMEVVRRGRFTVKAGSFCAPPDPNHAIPEIRNHAIVENHILMNDLECTSPSTAAYIIRGMQTNGWDYWKNKDGNLISIYKEPEPEDD